MTSAMTVALLVSVMILALTVSEWVRSDSGLKGCANLLVWLGVIVILVVVLAAVGNE